MRIGQATLRPVLESVEFSVPLQAFISDIGPADIAPHADWLYPQHLHPDTGHCRMSLHAWLIEANGKRILVDPCVGHQRHRPTVPIFHMLDSPFLERLAALGVAPEQIDYVFCTHLHVDHVGWNTRLHDGSHVPTFPNARYLFSRAEDDYWRSDMQGGLGAADVFNAGVYAECVQPVIAAGLADRIDAGTRIADCLTLIDAPGHTIGHLAGLLESAGEGAVLAGDAVHHPLQVVFPKGEVSAYDPAQALATRRRLYDLCVNKDYWLAPAHFRAPHLCKLRKEGESYRVEWAESVEGRP